MKVLLLFFLTLIKQMRVLVDRPTDLRDFLTRLGGELNNVRALYIVEPLLEKGQMIKFGVAGMSSGNAYNRLNDYAITYGDKTKANDCKGVIVHFVGVTEYNRHVQIEKSQVYQLERYLKQTYKSVTETGRGTERVPKAKLQDIMREIRSKKFKDVPTVLRDTNRETTKVYQPDKKAWKDSTTGHATRSTRQRVLTTGHATRATRQKR